MLRIQGVEERSIAFFIQKKIDTLGSLIVQNLLENAAVPDLISHTSQMRKRFMANHLLSERLGREESVVKNTKDIKVDSVRKEAESRIGSTYPDDDDDDDDEDEVEEEEESRSSATDFTDVEKSSVERYDVHSALSSLNIRKDEDQRSTAISFRADKNRRWEDTKESPERAGEQTNPEAKLSLVQRRLQMFEAQDKRQHVERKIPGKVEKSTVQDITAKQHDTWDSAPDVLRANEEEHLENSLENSIIKNMDKHKDNFENVKQRKEENLKLTNIERSNESFSRDITWMNDEERLDVQLEENLITSDTEIERNSFVNIEDEEKEANEMIERPVGDSVLTAKSINLSDNIYPEHLNPFNSDEENSIVEDKGQTAMDTSRSSKVSTNPFDSENEDIEEPEPPKPAIRSKFENRETVIPVARRILAAPQINLNPFWSDEEEEERDSEEEGRDRTPPQESLPVPKPRTIKYVCILFDKAANIKILFRIFIHFHLLFFLFLYFSILTINQFFFNYYL